MAIYLVAIPFIQVFPAAWFGPTTCPSCQYNSSWAFAEVEIQWELIPFKVWLDGDKRPEEDQVTLPIFSVKNDHISGYLWDFSLFCQVGSSFFLPLEKVLAPVFNLEQLKYNGFCWLPASWARTLVGTSGQARAVFPLYVQPYMQQGNLDLQEKEATMLSFPATLWGGQKSCCI